MRQTPTREELPERRSNYTHRITVGGQVVYIATGEYDDGRLGEIFIDVNKTGSVVRALLNALAMAVSRGLQYGVPLQEFVDSFKEFHFHPCGVVEGDTRIKEAESILSAVFMELEETYIKHTPYVPEVRETETRPEKVAGHISQGSGV